MVVVGAGALVATSAPPDEVVADPLQWEVDVAPGESARAVVHLVGTADTGTPKVFGTVAVRWKGPGDPPSGATLRWSAEQAADVVTGEQVGWEQNVRWEACQGCETGVRLELSIPTDSVGAMAGQFELVSTMQVDDPGSTEATVDATLEPDP